MAGVRIDIEFDDRQAREAWAALAASADDLLPVFEDIGEYLLLAHHERWRREQAPDGTPWAPLSPAYAARKETKKPAAGLLVFEDELRALLRYQISGNTLEFGTDRVYGATHQFGREEANIPARPFLGLDDDDSAAVLNIIRDHLAEVLR